MNITQRSLLHIPAGNQDKSIVNTGGGISCYTFCAALLPFVLFLYLYQTNIEYLSLWQVLLFCAVTAIIMIAGFYVLRFFIKSDFGAFIFAVLMFFAFFTYRPLLSGFSGITALLKIPEAPLYYILYFSCIIALAAVLTYRATVIKPLKKVFDYRFEVIKIKIYPAVIALFVLSALLLNHIFNLYYRLFKYSQQGKSLFYLIILIAIVIAYFCRKYDEKLKSKYVKLPVLIFILVMITQSVFNIVIFAAQQKVSDNFYKSEFTVYSPEQISQQPNIYWFHTDGMLGFDAMSRFFGDDQEEFTKALEERGFWINTEASFDGSSSTQWALPALMNPYYYDRVLSWRYDTEYAQSISINKDIVDNPNNRLMPNSSSNRRARENNEMILAFNTAGFDTSTIATFSMYFYPITNRFYEIIQEEPLHTTNRPIANTIKYINNISMFRDFVDLLADISPIPNTTRSQSRMRQLFTDLNKYGFDSSAVEQRYDLFDYPKIDADSRSGLGDYNILADCLYDILRREESPKFSVIAYYMAHRPFSRDEYGNHSGEDSENPLRYPPNHTFAANTLLKYIDIILEYDPDAVIVLQADHGLHGVLYRFGIDAIMEMFDCTEKEAEALWNSVMSAVRLPDDMMSQETKQILSDPRNISRFLVNNFAGENYEYIPAQYRQEFKGPER